MNKLTGILLVSFLIFGCGEKPVASFWIDENPKYEQKIKSVHSAMVVFHRQDETTEVSLIFRGEVKYDGDREILMEIKISVVGQVEKYEIEWIDPNSCKFELFVDSLNVRTVGLSYTAKEER